MQKEGKISYADFVWFLISEEDKKTPTRWVSGARALLRLLGPSQEEPSGHPVVRAPPEACPCEVVSERFTWVGWVWGWGLSTCGSPWSEQVWADGRPGHSLEYWSHGWDHPGQSGSGQTAIPAGRSPSTGPVGGVALVRAGLGRRPSRPQP